jgi:hypothetical protein
MSGNNLPIPPLRVKHTGWSIKTRIQQHHQHIWLIQPDKSVVAENRFNHGHLIKLQDTKILFIKSSYMNQLLREATELEIQPHNKNRDDGLNLSRSWRPLIWSLRESRWFPQERWLAHGPSKDHTLLALLPWNNDGFTLQLCFSSEPLAALLTLLLPPGLGTYSLLFLFP